MRPHHGPGWAGLRRARRLMGCPHKHTIKQTACKQCKQTRQLTCKQCKDSMWATTQAMHLKFCCLVAARLFRASMPRPHGGLKRLGCRPQAACPSKHAPKTIKPLQAYKHNPCMPAWACSMPSYVYICSVNGLHTKARQQ